MMPGEKIAHVEKNQRFEKRVQVFNFDVYKYRSYFAGAVLVHERCGSTGDDPVKKEIE